MNKVKLAIIFLSISINNINAEYASKVADIMSYYSYKGQQLTPANLYKVAPKLSKAQSNNVKSWIKKNKTKFDIERLLKNPKSWVQTGTLDILNNRLIEYALKSKIGETNYVFTVKELNLLFKISSFENRVWNIIRGTWSDEGFYEYKNGTFSLEKMASINPETKTYQTASRIAGYLVLKEALEKNDIKDFVLPDLFLFTLDGTSDVSDCNTIVLEPQIVLEQLGEPVEEYIKNNKLDDQLIKNVALLIVEANLWNLNKPLYISQNKKTLMNKQLHIFDLEQPNKARPQDAFLTQHTNFALGRDLVWNVISGLAQFYGILKEGKHDEFDPHTA